MLFDLKDREVIIHFKFDITKHVAALARQRRGSKELADGVPRAHVAGRVGARRFADGRLIDEHHARQLFGAQQALVCAGRFGGLAKVAQQRRGQHVLSKSATFQPILSLLSKRKNLTARSTLRISLTVIR